MTTASEPHESLQREGRPGDGAAAAQTQALYAEYGRTVSGLCRALLRSRTEAEDAAQQTFLSAHRALLNGSRPEQPAAWLATIARNECWSRIRTRMREPLPAEAVEAASAEPDPLAEAIRNADLAALWLAIEALPRPQRNAFLLREFGGLSYDELAAALAVSTPAVESLLFRARRRLRAKLRATFASVTGASWLETLARAFAGGSAPVAAKVVALGVGAAAVTGGAVVAPDVLDRTHMALPPPAHRASPATRSAPAAPILGEHRIPPARTPAAPPATAAGSARPDGDRREKRGGRESGSTSGDDRGRQQPTAARESSGERAVGSDAERGSGSGPESGPGSSGRDGDSATATVPAPTVDPAPTVTAPSSDDVEGDGGGGGELP